MPKYKDLVLELRRLAEGHSRDRASYTAARLREAADAIEDLEQEHICEEDDGK